MTDYNSVCGTKHSSSHTKTFWIQCESCNSWYHVAKNCIGFDDKKANTPDFVWNCEACVPEIESEEEVDNSNNDNGHNESSRIDEFKDDDSNQTNLGRNEPQKENTENEERAIAPTVTTREIDTNDEKERSHLSPDSISSPTDQGAARPFTHCQVNAIMPSTNEAAATSDISFDDDSNATPSAPLAFVSPKPPLVNYSKISSPSGDAISANLEGPQSKPKPLCRPPTPTPPEPESDQGGQIQNRLSIGASQQDEQEVDGDSSDESSEDSAAHDENPQMGW